MCIIPEAAASRYQYHEAGNLARQYSVSEMSGFSPAQSDTKYTSRTLLLPLLWLPSTHICGRSICDAEEPTAVKTSWSLLITETISRPRPVGPVVIF